MLYSIGLFFQVGDVLHSVNDLSVAGGILPSQIVFGSLDHADAGRNDQR